jgi:S-formylglutathione hydrolase FrmB
MALIQLNFWSTVLERSTNVHVILPQPSTRKTKESTALSFPGGGKRFQTLYLLHGGGGNAAHYTRMSRMELLANERRLAVVMPEVSNSFYSDMLLGPRDFTYISEELPAVMEAIFPLSRIRENRFVAGSSMGAQGSFKWALRRPEFFAAAVGFYGVSDYSRIARRGAKVISFEDCFGSLDDFAGNENNLEFLARENMRKGVDLPRLYACMGTEDVGIEHTRAYVEMAREIGMELEYHEGPGGHDNFFWDSFIERVLDWLRIKNDFVLE